MYSNKTGPKDVHRAPFRGALGGLESDLKGLSFELHALICQKESMNALAVYLNVQKCLHIVEGFSDGAIKHRRKAFPLVVSAFCDPSLVSDQLTCLSFCFNLGIVYICQHHLNLFIDSLMIA